MKSYINQRDMQCSLLNIPSRVTAHRKGVVRCAAITSRQATVGSSRPLAALRASHKRTFKRYALPSSRTVSDSREFVRLNEARKAPNDFVQSGEQPNLSAATAALSALFYLMSLCATDYADSHTLDDIRRKIEDRCILKPRPPGPFPWTVSDTGEKSRLCLGRCSSRGALNHLICSSNRLHRLIRGEPRRLQCKKWLPL